MQASTHIPKANPRLCALAPRSLWESTPINALPVEILKIIFKMIHSDLLSQYNDVWEEVSDDEITNPSLFPYSISAVCRQWDAILAPFEEFWTRIVVCIDKPDHLELLKLSLNRSKSSNLHSISVIRSSQDKSVVDPLEKDKVHNVLRVLSGQVSRSQSLVIRTLTTDSLPACVRTAWDLQTLRLESRQRAPHAAPPKPQPLSDHTVDCSNLCFLSLTGPIFVTLWRNEKWRRALESRGLESLTIAHLRAEDGGEKPFTFQELWNSFCALNRQYVNHLSWINIDVPYINSAGNITMYQCCYDRLSTSSFTFDTVPARVLRAFYYLLLGFEPHGHYSSLGLQKFHNCSFYGCFLYPGFPFSNRVEVSGYSNSDSLSLFFEICDAHELLIRDCPGLNDASMMALQGPFPFACHEERTMLPSLWSLEIQDCPNLSINALKEFVEFRKGCSESDYPVKLMANEIGKLTLVGSCPPLLEEEKEWFKANVDEFENENVA